MRIEVIKGKNLASLEGDFCLDFTQEPLASAGIFAIAGPTGAGKSTLLDAMCLALYGKTPRTEQAREANVRVRDVQEEALLQGDPRFILRRGTASGYAEVVFVALNGERYRARWAVSRAREKENGRLQSVRTSLFNCTSGEEVPGTRTELLQRVVELSGLTFEQFTRSVLLAQNDFATFLKAEQGDKAALLEKLTGTERFSRLSVLIYQRYAKAREELTSLETRLQGLDLLDEPAEQALARELEAVTTRVCNLEKIGQERDRLRELLLRLEKQQQDERRKQEEAETALRRSEILQQEAEKACRAASEQLLLLENGYKQARTEIQEARKLDVTLQSLHQASEEAKTAWQKAQEGVKQVTGKLKKIQKQQEQCRSRCSELQQWKVKYQAKQPIAEQLPALLLHLEAAAEAGRQGKTAEREIQDLQRQEQLLLREIQRLQQQAERRTAEWQVLERSIQAEETRNLQHSAEALEKDIRAEREVREALLLEQAAFVATGDIREMRERLVDGAPCPVCGSLSHPYALPEQAAKMLGLSERIARVTQKILALEQELAAFRSAEKKLAQARKQLLVLQKEQMMGEQDLNRKRQELAVSENRRKEVTVRLDAGKKQQEKALCEADRLFGNETWRKAWMQDADTFVNTLQQFAADWKKNTETIVQLEQESERWQAEEGSITREILPAWQEQEKRADETYRQKLADLQHRQKLRAGLLQGKPADEVEASWLVRIETQQKAVKGNTEEQSRQLGLSRQLKGMLEQLQQTAGETCRQLEESRKAWQQWQETHAVNTDGITFDSELQALRGQKGECEFRLRVQAQNRQRWQGLKEEIEKARLQNDRWAKLNELAGSADGAKFRRIAQGYTLDLLLEHANVQLRNLSRRYRLERVPDTLALQVVDRDMCDEVRSVHSLSGGESFLVSLALALGLSSLSSNRMKVESLFIDEGFGSLDAETLRIAMDALENLRTQGRKIGVISHVYEMTERIPVRIQVTRSGNGRSRVEVVYQR